MMPPKVAVARPCPSKCILMQVRNDMSEPVALCGCGPERQRSAEGRSAALAFTVRPSSPR